jgi:cyclopropane fatty-acyl-phospholipid synthase-like methyltransferase
VSEAHKRVVEAGYDRVAERYLSTKDPEDTPTLEALEDLARGLPPESAVLDLGCGAGIPATRWLAQRFTVTGVDISARQLELARQRVPTADFLKADMTDLHFAPETFDAVVALHSIIHVPRTEHLTLLQNIRRWLKPGGAFLATLSVGEGEGEEGDWEGWGAAMRWSHYDGEANLKMLREAGFEVVWAEARTGRGTGDEDETWLWVLARKPL